MEEQEVLVEASQLDVEIPRGRRWRWRKYIITLCVAAAVLVIAISVSRLFLDFSPRKELPQRLQQSLATGIHILLLEADQVRPDAHALGKQNPNYESAITPNLDGLAREGVRFSRAYSSTPICTPARLALLTGRSPFRHGMRAYRERVTPVNQSRMELVSTLKAHGYDTIVVGKNHYGVDGHLHFRDHGFMESMLHEGLLSYDSRSQKFLRLDHYGEFFKRECPGCDPLTSQNMTTASGWRATPGATPFNSAKGYAYPYAERLHPTNWVADVAIGCIDRWMSRRNAGSTSPLFLKVSFHRPHNPYDPPARWLRVMLNRIDSIMPPAFGEGDQTYEAGADCTAARREYCGSGCGYQSFCGRMDINDVKLIRAHYLASLSFVDEQAGRVLDRLRAAEAEWRRSFIVYLSDHGDALGDHHLWRKGYGYEQLASIPFYVRWPDAMDTLVTLTRGSTLMSLVELRDVFPTLADVAGIQLPSRSDPSAPDGRSLLPLLQREGATSQVKWRDVLVLELALCNFRNMSWVALVTEGPTRSKYIRYLDGREHLFHLTADPLEVHDLAAVERHGSELRQLRARLVEEFQQEQRGSDWVTFDGDLTTSSDCHKYELLPAYGKQQGVQTKTASTTRRVVQTTIGATPLHAISPQLYSGFLETEINFGGEGGLFAELVRNRDFEALGRGCVTDCPDPATSPPWTLPPNVTVDGRDRHEPPRVLDDFRPWQSVGGAELQIDDSTAPFPSNPHSLRVRCKHLEGVRNPGYFGGVGVRELAVSFKLTLFARPNADMQSLRLLARLTESGRPLAQALVRAVPRAQMKDVANVDPDTLDPSWALYSATLQPTAMAKKAAVLEVVLLNNETVHVSGESSTFWLDAVSLFPSDAVGGLFRRDIFEKLRALRFGFLRAPGGNFLEGFGPRTRWDWKKTLGYWAARPGHYNSAWGYWVHDGFGLYEILKLCDLLGLPCQLSIFSGYSMKAPYTPLNESQRFAADALDMLEFANGVGDTLYSRLRRQMGRSQPFNLKRLEVGNEERDLSPEGYRGHYKLITERIWARHPELTIVASSRWRSLEIDAENPCLESGVRCDLWDEHYYQTPDEMASMGDLYDSDRYSRTLPKVFVGEFAANKPEGVRTLRAAVAESMFMLGLERNADVVVASAFAPLLNNVHGTQWRYNLINFNATHLFVLPSYHAQLALSQAIGTHTLSARPHTGGWLQPNAGGLWSVAASTTLRDEGGMVSLKVANYAADGLLLNVSLAPWAPRVPVSASAQILTAASADAENTLDAPDAVSMTPAPQTAVALHASMSATSALTVDVPPWSLVVVRVEMA